jgi:protein subunit release factor B
MTDSDPPRTVPQDDEALLTQCRIETFRAGGKGGQHQNATETGVRLVHRDTGVRAESRTERSQLQNRKRALARLREKLEALYHQDPERVPTRVPRREKRKRLRDKRRRGEVKRLRKPPGRERE